MNNEPQSVPTLTSAMHPPDDYASAARLVILHFAHTRCEDMNSSDLRART